MLKVLKCEIFNLFYFNDYYVMKSLQVGDLGADIKNYFFLNLGKIHIILSLLAFGQCTLAMITKKVFF